jgi:hypothetical protein
MKHLPLRECGYAIAFVLAMCVLYGGAYLALMQADDTGAGRYMPMLKYRFGGEWSKRIFAPAHEVDRRIRPELWRFEVARD